MGCFSSKKIIVVEKRSGDTYMNNKDYSQALECYKQELLFMMKNKIEPKEEFLGKISTCLECSASNKESLNFYLSLKNTSISPSNASQDSYSPETLSFINEKIAESYFKDSMYEEASTYLEELKHLYSKSCTSSSEKIFIIENREALCHKYLGNSNKALEIYKKLLVSSELENTTYLPIIYGNIASCYCSQGKNDLSLEFLEKSLITKQNRKIKNLAGTHINLAVVHFNLGNADKALEFLNNAESECSNHEILLAKIYNNQLACFIKLGRFIDAGEVIGKYQEIYKVHLNRMSKIHLASYFNNLIVFYYKTGKIEELEKSFGEFVEIFQGLKKGSFLFHQYFLTSGLYSYYKKQFTQALEEMLKAEELEGRYIGTTHMNASTHLNNIGALYMILGDQGKADFYFNKSL